LKKQTGTAAENCPQLIVGKAVIAIPVCIFNHSSHPCWERVQGTKGRPEQRPPPGKGGCARSETRCREFRGPAAHSMASENYLSVSGLSSKKAANFSVALCFFSDFLGRLSVQT